MNKFGYTLLLTVSFLAFNSCSNFTKNDSQETSQTEVSIPANSYGTYLAGRIAHYRQDFDTAAEYYMRTAQKDSHNASLLNKTYLMLASQGRIDEAAHFAELAVTQGDKNEFIPVILAAHRLKHNNYQEAIQIVQKNKSPLYKKLISPFIEAWAYTGLNDYKKAIAALEPIKKDEGMISLYHFHSGMINDYFNITDKATQHYSSIINDSNMELSVRTLEVICNFNLRHNNKEKALALSEKYALMTPPVDLLQKIHRRIVSADEKTATPMITSPQFGLAEAFFNIAAIVKHNSEVLDFSHIFIRLAIYENPDNDLARILLANILEMREMYKDANAIYDEIQASSPAYYIAQYKKAQNLRNMQDYKGAELLLKSLTIDYPHDYQTLLDLGDTLRLQEKYKEALKYYNQALEKHHAVTEGIWQVYYALGVTYEHLNNWPKAEEYFKKALELNPSNLLVLNYLGYSWLEQGKNTNQAIEYIAEAYQQAPYNASVIDSLGWAFYLIGKYDEAITYLEKAAETDPANAVINNHLGDAYWQGGRKNEARFQWNHVLSLKDDSGEINKQQIKQKISNGLPEPKIIEYQQENFDKLLSKINN